MNEKTLFISTLIGGLIATSVVKVLQMKEDQKRIDAERQAMLDAEKIARQSMEQEHKKRMDDIRKKGEEELKKQREEQDKDLEDFKKRCEEICRFHGFDFDKES